MSTTKQGRDNFQPRARPCIFMGYPFGQKGYKVMNLENHKFYVSRDVVFIKQFFLLQYLSKISPYFKPFLHYMQRRNAVQEPIMKF